MVAPYNATIQNNNKCPHGYPIGACPICNGMSGGGIPKDRNKPRKAGEMSYNECLAEWHRMQRAEQAKQQDKAKNLEALNIYKEINSKIADKISAFKEGFANFKNSKRYKSS